MKEPRSTEGFAKDTNSPKKINPEKNLLTFAKYSILIRFFTMGGKVYSARPSAQEKSGYRADCGAIQRSERRKGNGSAHRS